MNNPYPYSNDNKRYQTINYYFRNKYHQKVAKIPLNAGFTCPNRDGFKGTGGCAFCSSMGSGDSILCFDDSLQKQYQEGLKRMQKQVARLYWVCVFSKLFQYICSTIYLEENI